MTASLLLSLSLLSTPARATEWPDLTTLASPTGEGRNDAAVLVAIEDYAKVDDVLGARANADAWMRWFVGGRGVPASRVFRAYDGDATDLKLRELARKAAAAVQPGGTLWFVFIGHGAPSRDGADGLLVGVDADRSADGIYGRSVSRKELLGLLDAGGQAQTVAFLDACFSGQGGDGQALVSGLQPLVPTALLGGGPGRARVLTAAGSGEFSGPLAGTARPAFSYLALGGLMGWADVDGVGNRDGRVSAEELREYVTGALNVTVSGRSQTPALLGEDADLGRATARQAPDLLAMVAAPTRSMTSVDAGGASLDTSTDFAAIAARAAAAKAARETAEREAADAAARAAAAAKARAEAQAAEQARLEAELKERRRAELDRQAGEVKAKATRDYAALAPLLTGEVSPETKPVLEAYVKQYTGVKVRFDGVEETVEVPEAAKVTAVLGRPTAGKMGYAMVRIQPGTFTMGSPASEPDRSNDETVHQVTLTRAYLMGTTEVTQGLWTKVMGSNPSKFTACGADCPVEQVSWCDAVVFANKLSAAEGFTAAYTLPAGFSAGMDFDRCNAAASGVRMNRAANGYRLPTEAEWEFAARAGEQALYAGGNDLDAVGWYGGNSGSMTHPVGRKRANAWGLQDMSGNVWEWTWDVYGDYPGAVTDPLGVASGPNRVNRGGSWLFTADDARAAYRYGSYPGRRYDLLGLRLSRTLP